ncbi:hypothetical protein SeLEV6574_g00491 [Synchytrium endobioticum]|uniref:Uncharacterized protein n=1 Tax=Synchytrium endobioticum TaxID=286115 RepID=A0A507DI58_9FUNG|nr:hypothetical protein SeLEV6574_g00491 [Synchytrium endobioticum]
MMTNKKMIWIELFVFRLKHGMKREASEDCSAQLTSASQHMPYTLCGSNALCAATSHVLWRRALPIGAEITDAEYRSYAQSLREYRITYEEKRQLENKFLMRYLEWKSPILMEVELLRLPSYGFKISYQKTFLSPWKLFHKYICMM